MIVSIPTEKIGYWSDDGLQFMMYDTVRDWLNEHIGNQCGYIHKRGYISEGAWRVLSYDKFAPTIEFYISDNPEDAAVKFKLAYS